MKNALGDDALNQIFREARTGARECGEDDGCAVNRSFSRQATSSRISYATLVMPMSRNFSREGRSWHSTRPARFYEQRRLNLHKEK